MDPKTVETFHSITPFLFWLIAIPTGVCAIATVVAQNIVRAATWLLFTLAGTSALFFLLGADLVGATQLLVYVGGTLVLVVFGVMLTAQGPFISMKTSGAEWAISVVAGTLLFAVIATAVMSEQVTIGAPRLKQGPRFKLGGTAEVTPDVKKFAPEFSRAEREKHAIRLGLKKEGGPPQLKGVVVPGGKGGGPPKGVGVAPKVPPKQDAKKDAAANDSPKGAGKGLPPQGQAPVLVDFDGPGGRPPVLAAPPNEEFALDPATSPQAAVLGQGFLGVGVGPAHAKGTYLLTPRKLTTLKEVAGVPASVVTKLEPLTGHPLTREMFAKELSIILTEDERRFYQKKVMEEAGQVVRASYLLPFEIVSVHLLVVLIGAAYLARAKRRRGAVS
jgi:NADH:ubiquinone oxidoreductase subunit 6 (subunit J)